ncbi:MAG: hypothetical protein M1821_003633 [Bathelium mastoideum]|nr:MAG: hypothetical protein M1821_003633 [Bathelium mastoideum]
MAPTERSILNGFLLPAATLPSAISSDEFTELFPEARQASPEIGQLYRELQHQRAIDADDVKHNIEAEARRGEKMKRDVACARKVETQEHTADTTDAAMEITASLFGTRDALPRSRPHTLRTVQPAIADACRELEVEIAEMEAETKSLLRGAETTLGRLGDLDYGFDGVEELSVKETLESIQRLQETCRDINEET